MAGQGRGLVGTGGVVIGTTFGLLGMTIRIPLLERAVPLTCGLFVGWRRQSLLYIARQWFRGAGATGQFNAPTTATCGSPDPLSTTIDLSRTPQFPGCEGRA